MAARSLQGKMFEACEADDVIALARWVGEGANILVPRNYKQLSIHVAAISDAVRCTRWLLDKGAPLDGRCSGLCTPLMWAVHADAHGAFDVLADRGANTKALDRGGRTALHLACNALKIDMIDKLIDLGLDANAIGGDVVTPMHSVCMFGNSNGDIARESKAFEAWQRLHAAGGRWTDVARRDSDNFFPVVSGTPLAWALTTGYTGLVFRALKAFEGSPGMPSLREVFPHPLHEAGRIGRGDIVVDLLEAGFDPFEKNAMDRTVIQVCETAAQNDMVSVMRAWTTRRSALMALDELDGTAVASKTRRGLNA